MTTTSPPLLDAVDAFDDAAASLSLPFINASDSGVLPGLDGTVARAALQTLIDNMGSAPGFIMLPPGDINLSPGVAITHDRQVLGAMNPYGTRLLFTPTAADQFCVDVGKNDGNALFQGGLLNLAFGSPDTAVKKTAVRLRDVSGFEMHRVNIGPIGQWSDVAKTSVGLSTAGRETSVFSFLNIAADNPVQIKHNYNAPGSALLDFDVCKFDHAELFAAAGKYCIVVDPDAQLGRLVIDNIDFISGAGGLYWKETGGPIGVAHDITMRDCYSEGLAANGHPDGAWIVFIDTVRTVRSVLFQGVNGGAGTGWGGFRLRGVEVATLLNCYYSGQGAGAKFWDMDNVELEVISCYAAGTSEISATNMLAIEKRGRGADGTAPTWRSETWTSTLGNANTAAGVRVAHNGIFPTHVTGTINVGAQKPIPDLGGGGTAMLRVWAKGATLNIVGEAMLSANGQLLGFGNGFNISGAPGVLTIVGGPSAWSLLNNTAENLSYAFVVENF